jgi:hypothetical protein
MHLSSGFERLTIYLRASMKLPHLIKTSATKSGSALVACNSDIGIEADTL